MTDKNSTEYRVRLLGEWAAAAWEQEALDRAQISCTLPKANEGVIILSATVKVIDVEGGWKEFGASLPVDLAADAGVTRGYPALFRAKMVDVIAKLAEYEQYRTLHARFRKPKGA